jgi:hypothetical protein
MGIDIYLKWTNQTPEEAEAQYKGTIEEASRAGYLRESYHGGPYATKVLFPELFGLLPDEDDDLGVEVDDQWSSRYPASVLEARLPKALATVIERCKVVYKEELTEDDPFVQAYVNFVALARRKEAETGEPCEVEASY